MSIGLDIDFNRFKSLRRRGEQLIGRGCRASYAVLADSHTHRRMLQQAEISFVSCQDDLVVLGAAPDDLQRLFQVSNRPILPGGTIPYVAPLVRQIIVALVDSLLPDPITDKETCCVTLPGCGTERLAKQDYHQNFLTRLVQLKGYTPQVLSRSMAVVLAELVSESFTGMGIYFGAVDCSVSLAHHGIEIAQWKIDRGTNRIAEQMKREFGELAGDTTGDWFADSSQTGEGKRSILSLRHDPQSRQERLLVSLYRELLAELLQETAAALQRSTHFGSSDHPLSIVCTGETTQIPGFSGLLSESLESLGISLTVKEPRIAADDEYTVARGCLISAELETRAQHSREQAA